LVPQFVGSRGSSLWLSPLYSVCQRNSVDTAGSEKSEETERALCRGEKR
jgi:hypothetical protein